MFGGGRRSSKSKNKPSNNTSNINPEGDHGGKKKLIPNLEIDDDHFFYSRLISREPRNTNNNKDHHPSFRVYYNDASVAVPFTWESQPGTPKSKFHIESDRHIISYPPLTPPPSYFSSSATATTTGSRRQLSKKQSSSFKTWPTKLFMSFRKQRINNNNNNKSYSVGSSSSSSDNSANSSLSPTRSISSTRDQRHSSDNLLYSRRKFSSLEALLDLKLEGSSDPVVDGSGSGSGSSPTSTLCFGGSSRLRGRYGWL